jgi:hypothetical protein
MMTRTKLVGLTVFALFAICAVMSASASALQWLLDGKPIEKVVHVNSSGTLLLADLAAPKGGTYIICKGTGEGTIGPLAHDEITEIKATECEFQPERNGECVSSKPVTARAVNLPWLTLLVTVGGETRDDILPTKAGKNPGWAVECTVLEIFRVEDECTTATGSPLVSNVAGGVTTAFSEKETASCTLGTATSGMVIGAPLNENPRGHTISVSNSPNQ